jgi:hypothetical protein
MSFSRRPDTDSWSEVPDVGNISQFSELRQQKNVNDIGPPGRNWGGTRRDLFWSDGIAIQFKAGFVLPVDGEKARKIE